MFNKKFSPTHIISSSPSTIYNMVNVGTAPFRIDPNTAIGKNWGRFVGIQGPCVLGITDLSATTITLEQMLPTDFAALALGYGNADYANDTTVLWVACTAETANFQIVVWDYLL